MPSTMTRYYDYHCLYAVQKANKARCDGCKRKDNNSEFCGMHPSNAVGSCHE
jgi:hypothetical protein